MAKENKKTFTYSCKPSVVNKAKRKSKKDGSVSELIQSLLEEYNGTSVAIPFSVSNLRGRLKKDSEFFLVWQANIAMAFYDEFKKEGALCDRETHKDRVHESCNKAAINFLNNLINKSLENRIFVEL